MARQFKSWGSHSARWQRQARDQGLSPARWNRWRNLPESTRQATDPRKYAQGESVRKQLHDQRVEKAVQNMKDAAHSFKPGQIEDAVDKMSPAQLKWTAEHDSDDIYRKMTDKNYAARHHGADNPWWY